MIKLSVVIVNYHSEKLLEDCLSSVFERGNPVDFEAIVVNNDINNSLSRLKDKFISARFVQSAKNIGFAAATNMGIKMSRGEYVLLLNPDTRIFPETFEEMVGFMEHNPDAGIIGPRLLDAEGRPHSLASFSDRAPSPLGTLTENTAVLKELFSGSGRSGGHGRADRLEDPAQQAETIQGACFMIRRKTVSDIGLLDERFFLYWEDTDWCVRARKKGWNIYYLRSARCIHLGGQSSRNKIQDHYHYFNSMYKFYNKHYGLPQIILLKLLFNCLFVTGLFKFSFLYLFSGKRRKAASIETKRMLERAVAHAGFSGPLSFARGCHKDKKE